jgi:peroxiredoxin
MRRRGVLYLTIIAILTVALTAIVTKFHQPQNDALKQGKRIPDFSLANSKNDRITNMDLRGRKFGLLFIRLDCDHCVDEMIGLRELLPIYRGQFELLIISLTEHERTELLRSQVGSGFEIYSLPADQVSRLKVGKVPSLVLVDEAGTISYLQVGRRNSQFQSVVFGRFVRGESLTDEALRAAYSRADKSSFTQ